MSDIVLTAGVRANLLQLQSTAATITSTQSKLATGKRVNSAIDNPINFFTAQGLANRPRYIGTRGSGIALSMPARPRPRSAGCRNSIRLRAS